MSIIAAIDTAVRLQLVSEGKTRDRYSDYTLTMGAGAAATNLAYDAASISPFLQKVAMRLKCDTPSLQFDWIAVDPQRCVAANRETLINIIARSTQQAENK